MERFTVWYWKTGWLAVLFCGFLIGCNSEGAKHKAAGNVLFKKGDLDGALGEYRAAVSLNPRDANAHTLCGNALFEKESYEEAERQYQEALQLDASSRAALQGLAMLELRRHHSNQARSYFERMLANQPRDPEAHTALGKLLYADGDLNGADRHLRDALVYAQNDPAALYTLALVAAKKGDAAQANELFDRLERTTPGRAYAPYGRAVAAATNGKEDDALHWLGIALERGIDDLGEVERDSHFEALHSSARFLALVNSARRQPPRAHP